MNTSCENILYSPAAFTLYGSIDTFANSLRFCAVSALLMNIAEGFAEDAPATQFAIDSWSINLLPIEVCFGLFERTRRLSHELRQPSNEEKATKLYRFICGVIACAWIMARICKSWVLLINLPRIWMIAVHANVTFSNKEFFGIVLGAIGSLALIPGVWEGYLLFKNDRYISDGARENLRKQSKALKIFQGARDWYLFINSLIYAFEVFGGAHYKENIPVTSAIFGLALILAGLRATILTNSKKMDYIRNCLAGFVVYMSFSTISKEINNPHLDNSVIWTLTVNGVLSFIINLGYQLIQIKQKEAEMHDEISQQRKVTPSLCANFFLAQARHSINADEETNLLSTSARQPGYY